MIHPDKTTNRPADESSDWETSLQQLRANRSRRPQAEPAVSIRNHTAHSQNADHRRVLQEYLQQWQQQHNSKITESESSEYDAAVLLQEDWLAAQNAIQGEVPPQAVLSTQTVWINPKRHTPPEENLPKTEEAFAADEPQWEALPVSVNVLDPKAVAQNQPVFCLSEQELMQRLTQRLLPHLTDAVNGMVRTAIQKQAATLTYQLQKNLSEETPSLVNEILDYNLKATLAEIKYNLKFKR
ncbi:hypothetical protein V6667_04505 [Neisseria leonii]|uniref:Uncharacterized protein n=1 Tax=Neisseria leonii TaxID=2995413 RepID=A0A9X4DZU8_9NEIS|nr:hypothetical protein [Neisseria sp. 51.81]MDD9326885.1 hypothetical protein [Neisseria sp. 51.81]